MMPPLFLPQSGNTSECPVCRCIEAFVLDLQQRSITPVGVFHNRNPSNLDSSDQQIRLFCDWNLNLDYESVDLPLEVDQQIQCPWITHNSL